MCDNLDGLVEKVPSQEFQRQTSGREKYHQWSLPSF
jgi:hypothetical protein